MKKRRIEKLEKLSGQRQIQEAQTRRPELAQSIKDLLASIDPAIFKKAAEREEMERLQEAERTTWPTTPDPRK
jgi:hypothetical protein